MQTVYVLFMSMYHVKQVMGIFRSRELAEEMKAYLEQSDVKIKPDYFLIQPWPVLHELNIPLVKRLD